MEQGMKLLAPWGWRFGFMRLDGRIKGLWLSITHQDGWRKRTAVIAPRG